jgi:hypothetical protein
MSPPGCDGAPRYAVLKNAVLKNAVLQPGSRVDPVLFAVRLTPESK